MTVHNHPPYRPVCNEREIDGRLVGACLSGVGMCTHCGAVEVELVRVTGIRDLSHIGESDRYPTGYGCEVCA